MNLDQISALIKDRRLWLAAGIVGLLYIVWLFFLFNQHPTPSWKGLVPEKTGKNGVIGVLGNPTKTVTKNGFEMAGYKSDLSTRLNEIWYKSETVKLIKEQTGINDSRKPSTFKKRYGKANNLYSNQFADFQELNVYPNWGYAVLANSNNDVTYEIWYFKPTSLQNFVTNFGKDLLPYKPAKNPPVK